VFLKAKSWKGLESEVLQGKGRPTAIEDMLQDWDEYWIKEENSVEHNQIHQIQSREERTLAYTNPSVLPSITADCELQCSSYNPLNPL
jgi:hypothetical protein